MWSDLSAVFILLDFACSPSMFIKSVVFQPLPPQKNYILPYPNSFILPWANNFVYSTIWPVWNTKQGEPGIPPKKNTGAPIVTTLPPGLWMRACWQAQSIAWRIRSSVERRVEQPPIGSTRFLQVVTWLRTHNKWPFSGLNEVTSIWGINPGPCEEAGRYVLRKGISPYLPIFGDGIETTNPTIFGRGLDS